MALSPGFLGTDISVNKYFSPRKAAAGPVPGDVVCFCIQKGII
jgi:hypothetical protein